PEPERPDTVPPANQPHQRGEVERRQREEIRDEPEVCPREPVELRAEGGKDGEETLVERLGHRQTLAYDRLEAVLMRGAHAEAEIVEVEPAPELDVLDGRREQHAAGEERDGAPPHTLRHESTRPARLERGGGRPSREEEEQRHVPKTDEPAEHQERDRPLGGAGAG